MARTVKEWVAKHDDQMPGQNVRLRIAARQSDKCPVCTRALASMANNACDHIAPLADGGVNAESNLQILCRDCHGMKTGMENSRRAVERGLKVKHLSIAPKKRSAWATGRDKPFKSKIGGGTVLRATGEPVR
jgi:5-methylcytosine-specific restriction enzyme A